MRRRTRRIALLYAAVSAVVLAALVAVTGTVASKQREHASAVAEALHHEDLRAALWRMETRVGTLLATATTRSFAVGEADSRGLQNAWIDPHTAVANPAAPPDDDLQTRLTVAADDAYRSSLAVERCEVSPVAPAQAVLPQPSLEDRGAERSMQDYRWRADATNRVQTSNVAPGEEWVACVGPLAPVWVDPPEEELQLHLARRVEAPRGVLHESYRLEWRELEAALLAEVADLFPTARLVPILGDSVVDDGAARLAAIPARLVVPPPRPAEGLPRGHLWTLAGAWIATLAALASGWLAVRAGIAYGDKHRRFTHAVTHELRTPLTTFRMYSEMLARGMVPEGSRPDYLATLERESARLTGLVENVLRFARLEERRASVQRATARVTDLLDRWTPDLAARCAAAGARLEVACELEEDVLVTTDPDAALAVLVNLVDNACKYGCEGPDAVVRLRASRVGDRIAIDVRDEGPGVPAGAARAIFRPFERGGRDSSDPAPGVGLGLALARGLAREVGGDLELRAAERGAVFRFTLPLG